MVKCQICRENVQIIKSKSGFTTEGICKKTGLGHVVSFGAFSDQIRSEQNEDTKN